MPVKKTESAAEECCARCEKDIVALRKEIASLKRDLAKKSSGGGADPRVDVLIEALTRNPSSSWAKIINAKIK